MKLLDASAQVKLFALMFLFIEGSTILLNIAPSAGRSSWLSIIIASCMGILLIFGFFCLVRNQENTDYYGLILESFGRYAGGAVLYVYVLYFLYLGSRDVRDMTELISNAILVDTPTPVLAAAFGTLVVYALFLGLHALIRIAPFYFGLFTFVFILITALVFINQEYNLKELLPVFENGVMPVVEPSYTQLLFFPFGEALAVLVAAAPWIKSSYRAVRRASLWAVAAGGCFLAIGCALQVATLGVAIKNRSPFPMLGTFRNISVGMFIERVEVLFVFIMLITLTVKVAVFLYAAIKGIEVLTGYSLREMAVPLGILLCIQSIFIAKNTTDHFHRAIEIVPYYALIMEIMVPASLFLIVFLRKRKGRLV
ncbi:endospore germination permease [Paenibacillus sp. GCM10023252]|uniref:GerAB/ArcD/ProY family transporter n=1 Tax=Paenibacillus sp. GCM10023252 TaxID=3252649 RepID=UPI003622280A